MLLLIRGIHTTNHKQYKVRAYHALTFIGIYYILNNNFNFTINRKRHDC